MRARLHELNCAVRDSERPSALDLSSALSATSLSGPHRTSADLGGLEGSPSLASAAPSFGSPSPSSAAGSGALTAGAGAGLVGSPPLSLGPAPSSSMAAAAAAGAPGAPASAAAAAQGAQQGLDRALTINTPIAALRDYLPSAQGSGPSSSAAAAAAGGAGAGGAGWVRLQLIDTPGPNEAGEEAAGLRWAVERLLDGGCLRILA